MGEKKITKGLRGVRWVMVEEEVWGGEGGTLENPHASIHDN